jgi:hypothetical protein
MPVMVGGQQKNSQEKICDQLVELDDSKLHPLDLVHPYSYLFLPCKAGGVGSQQEQHK